MSAACTEHAGMGAIPPIRVDRPRERHARGLRHGVGGPTWRGPRRSRVSSASGASKWRTDRLPRPLRLLLDLLVLGARRGRDLCAYWGDGPLPDRHASRSRRRPSLITGATEHLRHDVSARPGRARGQSAAPRPRPGEARRAERRAQGGPTFRRSPLVTGQGTRLPGWKEAQPAEKLQQHLRTTPASAAARRTHDRQRP